MMKKILTGLLISSSVLASQAPMVTSCKSTINIPDQKIELDVSILKENGSYRAITKQVVGGEISESEDEVTAWLNQPVLDVTDQDSYEVDDHNLGIGDMTLIHAYFTSKDPELGPIFDTGIDLGKVREVDVYQVGEVTKFGSLSIVDARDAEGKTLGSFLGGFLVGSCAN